MTIRLLSSMISVFLCIAAQAGSPVWRFSPLTATTLSVSPSATAIVKYKITNQSTRTHRLTMQAIQGITQLTTGDDVCQDSFTLTGKASCTLSLQINGNQLTQPISDGPTVCEQGSSLQCYRPNASDVLNITLTNNSSKLYVSNFGIGPGTDETVSICDILTDGSLANCAASYDSAFQNPCGIASANISNNRILYVANIGANGVSICAVNPDGSLQPCNNAEVTTSATYSLTINPDQTYLYLTRVNFANVVNICPLSEDGFSIGTCSSSSGNGTFSKPTDITFNKSGTIAYITNYTTSTVSVCPVINGGASFDTCTTVSANEIQSPRGISFNATGTIAYILNVKNDTLAACSVSDDGMTFSQCETVTNSDFNFSGYYVQGLFMSSSNNFGYIPSSGDNTMLACPINRDGSLGTCSVTEGFYDPQYVTKIDF